MIRLTNRKMVMSDGVGLSSLNDLGIRHDAHQGVEHG